MRIITWLLVLAGLALTAFGLITVLGQASSGAQPWSAELSDNFVFIKVLPFVLGFGVAAGMLMARTYGPKVRSDGAIRRWSPGTVFGHAVLTIGFVLAIPTGMWQYLGGIIDVNLPIPIYLFYRVHYIGAAILLFAVAAFMSYLWMTGDRSLLIPRGQWSRHLLGLAYELPPRIRAPYAKLLRVDLQQPRPPTGQFTFYEKVVEFPELVDPARAHHDHRTHQSGPVPHPSARSCSIYRVDLARGGYGGDRDQAARPPSVYLPPLAPGGRHHHDLGQRALRAPAAPRLAPDRPRRLHRRPAGRGRAHRVRGARRGPG